MIRAKDYLYPSHLQENPTNLDRVMFVGSCAASDYVSKLNDWFPEKEFEHILFNYVSELPEAASRPITDYQCQVIQLPLRNVIGDKIIRFKDFIEHNEQFVLDSLDTLHLMLEAALAYNRRHNILSIVTNFIVPQAELVADMENSGSLLDLRGLTRRLNEEIVSIISSYENTYLLDVENIASVIGKRYFLNDFISFSTQNVFWMPDWNSAEQDRIEEVPHIETISPSHLDQFIETIWRGIESIYRSANHIDQVKLVIFDLDDTMWRGIIGEHYGDGPTPMTIGWPHGMQEAVHYLKARGILTAVCSKNSLEVVTERWERAVPLGFVTLEDFTFVEISWSPKVEAIERIMSNANLTPRSVVFVDDNPVERQSVAEAFPGIRVLAASPFETRRVLLNAPETQVPRRTTETANREAMILQGMKREGARSSLSRQEFLASLGCEVDVFPIASEKDPQFGRAFELLNKTNQFNTTGKRWTFDEVSSFLSSGGEVHAFKVSDKYTAYGLVGLILMKDRHVTQFVMSCRTLGLEIEESVLRVIMARKMRRAPWARQFTASLIHTKENMPSRSLYANLGFQTDRKRPDRLKVTLLGGNDVAPHLRINEVVAAT